jgi:BirA family biotin operon repressor/biotin-[acetyl-CoA-carboxylase] ligase
VLWLDECESTNAEALARLDTPGLKAVCAHRQTAGRGRQGRRWYSDPALCMSWIARPPFEIAHGGLLPLMAAVVLAEYCEALGATATVKWPNDLLIESRKLAGILCEARTDRSRWAAVVGIGLNVVTPEGGWPADVPGVALDALMHAMPDRAALAQDLVGRLDARLERLSGPVGRRRMLHDWLDFAPPEGTPMRRGDLEGRFAGLEPDGALRLQTAQGLTIVHTGDVHLIRTV